MIKRIAVILVLAYVLFMMEFVLYGIFGAWGKPELLVLLFVFFNLYLGIRFSIIAAVAAGLLRDAFSTSPVGTYLFIYVLAAYWTTIVSKYLYQPGSRFSRALVAFFVVLFCFVLEVFLHLREHEVRLVESLTYVLLPQLIMTMLAATFVFHRLRDACVFFRLKG